MIPNSFAQTVDFPTHEITLNNGLSIIVREDHRAKMLTTQLWYHVGSADEPSGQTGISHVLEHLMFEGTTLSKAGEFSKAIYNLGGHDNAFTTKDYTAYYQTIHPDDLDLIFSYEADRMQNLIIDPAAFQKERNVVIEERQLRVDNRPISAAYEIFQHTAYAGNPYGQPIIGWQNDLQQLTVSMVENWYRTWYAPNNATLVVVGDVEPEQVFHLAKTHFEKIKPKSLPDRQKTQGFSAKPSQNIQIPKVAKLPAIFLGFNVPSYKTAAQEHISPTLAIIEVLLGNADSQQSGALVQNLLRDQNIVSSISASYNPWQRGDSLFSIFAVPNIQQKITSNTIVAAALNQITQLKKGAFSDTDLSRAKTQIIARAIFEQDAIFEQAKIIGSLESLGLPWQTADQFIRKINLVTRKQVMSVATSHLDPQTMTQATLIPQNIQPQSKPQ